MNLVSKVFVATVILTIAASSCFSRNPDSGKPTVTRSRIVAGNECLTRVSERGESFQRIISSLKQDVSHLENPDAFKQNYKVTIHLDFPGGFPWLVLSSHDFAYSEYVPSGTVTLNMPPGYYDLCCSDNSQSESIIVLDKFHVYKNIDTTISSSSAIHQVSLQIKDENGSVLSQPGNKSGYAYGFLVKFHDGVVLPDVSSVMTTRAVETVMISDIPEGLKVLFSRQGFDRIPGNRYKLYVVNYPFLSAVTNDTLMTNESGDLHHVPHVFDPSYPDNSIFYCWGYGPVLNDSLTGYLDNFFITYIDNTCPHSGNDTVDYYITNSAGPSVYAFFASAPDKSVGDPISATSLCDIQAPISYIDHDNNFVMSADGNYPRVPADYVIKPANAARFGTGAPVNISMFRNNKPPNSINLVTFYKGQSNEKRYLDNPVTSYEIWQNGTLLLMDTLSGIDLNHPVPGAGVFDLIMTDTNYILPGIKGIYRTEHHFNMNLADPDPPVPVSFQILKDDTLSGVLVKGSPCIVRFTAGDYSFDDEFTRHYKPLSEVQLYVKSYPENEWQQCNLTADPTLFDSLSGLPYSSNLMLLMQDFPDSSFVDLKIVLKDFSGNETTQTYHPAFMIRDPVTGVEDKVLHAVNIYPNPAGKIIRVDLKSDDIHADVISAEGKIVISTDKKSVDISGLQSGIYILRITSGGKESYFRFIKK